MGLFTSFLSLFKPDYTDAVDIADINSNMDKIDARFKGIDNGTFAVNKATKLATARKINGVNFNGESDITITAAANGGTSAACSGNAATATKLATARNINGVAFDGTKNITIADSTKAPKSHASTGTSYGVGTTTNYGHVKIANDLLQSSYANGVALSAYQGYLLKQELSASKNNILDMYESSGTSINLGAAQWAIIIGRSEKSVTIKIDTAAGLKEVIVGTGEFAIFASVVNNDYVQATGVMAGVAVNGASGAMPSTNKRLYISLSSSGRLYLKIIYGM
jgi:hypothetical protein